MSGYWRIKVSTWPLTPGITGRGEAVGKFPWCLPIFHSFLGERKISGYLVCGHFNISAINWSNFFCYVYLLTCVLFRVYLNNMFLKLGLQSWEDIDKLNSFPKLEEVRLLGIPLLQPYSTEERRKLVIARSVVLITLVSLSGPCCFIKGMMHCLGENAL